MRSSRKDDSDLRQATQAGAGLRSMCASAAASSVAFAAYSGTAPIGVSSGQRKFDRGALRALSGRSAMLSSPA
jgi:hypothetical protein